MDKNIIELNEVMYLKLEDELFKVRPIVFANFDKKDVYLISFEDDLYDGNNFIFKKTDLDSWMNNEKNFSDVETVFDIDKYFQTKVAWCHPDNLEKIAGQIYA